jgi:SPP1 gp7 family putative phage head morphogenesis protein
MARTQRQIEADAEATRRRQLAAEAAALLLLLQARDRALQAGVSLEAQAAALELELVEGIQGARRIAAASGLRAAEAELLAAEIQADVSALSGMARAEAVTSRARSTAGRVSQRWLSTALEAEGDALAASQAATGAIQKRLGVIATTETGESFNIAKKHAYGRAAPDLWRVWDAAMDKRTCPICERAHGEIVRVNESFPSGEPGSVHGNCRCTFTILTAEEVGDFTWTDAA